MRLKYRLGSAQEPDFTLKLLSRMYKWLCAPSGYFFFDSCTLASDDLWVFRRMHQFRLQSYCTRFCRCCSFRRRAQLDFSSVALRCQALRHGRIRGHHYGSASARSPSRKRYSLRVIARRVRHDWLTCSHLGTCVGCASRLS